MRKGKTCVRWADLVRAYPDLNKTVCFYPKQASLSSVTRRTPRSKNKIYTWSLAPGGSFGTMTAKQLLEMTQLWYRTHKQWKWTSEHQIGGGTGGVAHGLAIGQSSVASRTGLRRSRL